MTETIIMSGDLDLATAEEAWNALRFSIAQYGPRLILDLSELTFLDCAGLRVLLRAREECEAAGGYLHVTEPQGEVLRLLELLESEISFREAVS